MVLEILFLVCCEVLYGCNDHRLQCKLLAEDNLTFHKALKIAQEVETAERDSRGMQEPLARGPNSAVHSVSTRKPKQAKRVPLQMDTCYRCGGKHNSASCKYKDSECHFCGAHQLNNESQSDMLENTEYSIFHSTCGDTTPYIVSIHVVK